MKGIFFISMLAALSTSPAFASDTVKPLRASTPWNVNFANNSCELKRIFGSGKEQILLTYIQSGSFEGGELFLILRGSDKKSERTDFTLLPKIKTPATGTEPREGTVYNSAEPGFVIWRLNGVSDDYLSEAGKQSFIEVKAGKRDPIRLSVNNMDQAMTTMNNCQTQLFESFGLDYAAISALKSRPTVRNFRAWAKRVQQSYPSEAQRKGHQGTVRFMLTIDAEGKPSGCRILMSSGYKSLDEAACKYVNKKRPRFWPARDANGDAVEAPYVSAVRFTM